MGLDSHACAVLRDFVKVVFGVEADASLERAAAGIVATGGGFRVGQVGDAHCAAAGDSGTLRWSTDKASLQVCDGDKAKWNSAGAATLDAAENDECTADLEGALQWNAETKVLKICTSSAWADIYTPPEPKSTGSYRVATIGGTKYAIHTLTASGTFTAQHAVAVDVLMVGGGGSGGGRHGGGGGGGGVLHCTSMTVSPGSHDVVIGAGGAAVFGSSVGGNAGGDTTFAGEVAKGGGGGGSYSGVHGGEGGSGGGGGHGDTNGGAATQQHFVTSNTCTAYGSAGANNPSGGNEAAGGGGAGSTGEPGAAESKGGNGGAGVQIDIDGNNMYWGGGGGGGGWVQRPGHGGKGGGGAGRRCEPSHDPALRGRRRRGAHIGGYVDVHRGPGVQRMRRRGRREHRRRRGRRGPGRL